MLAGRNRAIKSQDILIILKIVSLGSKSWRMIDLAHDLDLSPSEVSLGLERLKLSGLLDSEKKKPYYSALLEFLIHGLKYVFPVDVGSIQRGVPTAHSYGSSPKKIVSEQCYIWPSEEGTMRGISVSPLYEKVPFAVAKDEKLHRLLALIDSLRIGRVREQNIARLELEKALSSES